MRSAMYRAASIHAANLVRLAASWIALGGAAHARIPPPNHPYLGPNHGFFYFYAPPVGPTLRQRADEANLVFIGINEQPKLIGIEDISLPQRPSNGKRLLEANVRIFDIIRDKDGSYQFRKFLPLRYESSYTGPSQPYLFFVRDDVTRNIEERRQVLHSAALSKAAENRIQLFGGGKAQKQDLALEVIHIWAGATPSQGFAERFAKIVADNVDQLELVTFLPVELARPTWKTVLASSYDSDRKPPQIVAQDIILRGTDDDIVALLQAVMRGYQIKNNVLKQPEANLESRVVEQMTYEYLRRRGGDRIKRLLIGHGDAEPRARISAAFALAWFPGEDVREAIERWQADDKHSMIRIRFDNQYGFPSDQSMLELLGQALAEFKAEPKPAVRTKRFRLPPTIEDIGNWIAQLDDEDPKQREEAERRLVEAGKIASDDFEFLAQEGTPRQREMARSMLAKIELHRLERWLDYINASHSRLDGKTLYSVSFHECLLNAEDTRTVLGILQRVNSLQSLDLEQANITDAELSCLAGFKGLRNLILDNPRITDVGLQHLAGLAELKSLDLDCTKVTDQGLAPLSSMKSLERLDLTGVKIQGDSLSVLNGLSHLKELSLVGSTVEDLRAIHDLPSLWKLDLGYSKITDAGLKTLDTLPTLREVFLNSTSVTDAGLVHLHGLANLQSLHLRDSQTTPEGRQKLRQVLPKAKITPEP